MKDKKNHPGYPGMTYKQAKTLATSAPMKQRNPAQFNSAGQHTGYFGPQAEASRKQSKQLKNTQKTLSRAIKQADVDITGAQKAKIFDQIDPKNNGPQRSKKLGY